ncbi:MAG: hypothetical protein ABIT05_00150 [Chitinophagaceae bacterium]
MSSETIIIRFDKRNDQVIVVVPLRPGNGEAKFTFQTRLGETIDKRILQTGVNRLSIPLMKEKSFVARVETAYETVVKEFE